MRPQRLEQFKDAGALGRQPERTGQTEVEGSGLQGERRSAVPDQRGNLLGVTEVRLVNNARLAIDACALDDIVVELLALPLRDEGRHIG